MRCKACFRNISLFDMAVLAPFQVQRQQAAEDFVVGHFGGVVGPAVGGGDGGVERLVGEVQPGGAGVVEVGQGALLEVGLVAGLGDRAFGEAGLFLFRGDDPVDPFGRVEPGFAQFVEAAGGGGDVVGDDLRRPGTAAKPDRRRGRCRAASGRRGRGRFRSRWSGCSAAGLRATVPRRSDQSSWKRECRMPKVASSARAMTIRFLSGTTVGWKPNENAVLGNFWR